MDATSQPAVRPVPTHTPARSPSPPPVQAFDTGFVGGAKVAAEFSSTTGSVTLTVVRPVHHPTHPINTKGPTSVVFATGNAVVGDLPQHGSNRGVRCHTRTVVAQCP